MYRILFTESARRYFEQADAALQRRLQRCFERLHAEPHRHPNIKPLRGPLVGHYRYRVGDYRVVYRIDEEDRVVVVVIIAHRREVYR